MLMKRIVYKIVYVVVFAIMLGLVGCSGDGSKTTDDIEIPDHIFGNDKRYGASS